MSETPSLDASISVGEATLQKLTDAFGQYAASAVGSATIPEFKGLPNEDVHKFLRSFKLATLTVKDDALKCRLMRKALTGAAHVWAKANVNAFFLNGDWKAVKRALVQRFSEPDREIRYQEKLNRMRFDEATGTLTSYIEGYADHHKKAFASASEADILKGLSRNLPPNIVRHLNTLSDTWTQEGNWVTFYKLIKRIEAKILPFEPKEDDSRNKTSTEEMVKLLNELKESINAQKSKESSHKAEITNGDNAIAAIGYNSGQIANQRRNRLLNQNKGMTRYDGYQSRYRYNRDQRNDSGPRAQPYPQRASAIPVKQDPDALLAAYEKKYGKIPGPCYHCGGQHFNRHCFYKDLN